MLVVLGEKKAVFSVSMCLQCVCVLAVLEEKKAGVQKEAADLRASLREVEKARLEARRELQELRRQVKMLDGERNKLGQEVGELQVRVARDEEKEDESRRENMGLKQKVGLTRFNKLPSRTKPQTACEQGSLWLIECSLKIINIQYYKMH